jgi:hypothetical protein
MKNLVIGLNCTYREARLMLNGDKGMNLKDRILLEIKTQEAFEGKVKDKELIIKILNSCKWESEFFAMVDVRFHRYGKLSYESHRFYFVKDYLKYLFKGI